MDISYGLQCALNAYDPENYVPFDDMIPQHVADPEQIAIEKDNFERFLSSESKHIVNLIFYSPETFSTNVRHGEISWTQIRTYLRKKQNLKWNRINKIRKEIMTWLEENK